MNNKKTGSEGFLSVLVSVSLVVVTLVFSGELVTALSSFALGSFSVMASVSEFKLKNEKHNLGKNDDYNVKGFGNGLETITNGTGTKTPEDIEKIMNEAVSAYASFKKTGDIDETKLGASSSNTVYGNVVVNNKTETKSVNIKKELSKKPSFGEITKDEPYILIYHTHTTEGYELLDKGWYSADYDSRTKDINKTVVRVGDEIVERLEKSGFKVIHDKTIYDELYNGAYERSREGITKILKENPSIKVVIDVHRDAIYLKDGTRIKPTTEINGKKAAQIMILTGCEDGNVKNFPDWEKNLTFAVQLQNKISSNNPKLLRPLMFCNRKYNMHLTPCSLLVEFGTDGVVLGVSSLRRRLCVLRLANTSNFL